MNRGTKRLLKLQKKVALLTLILSISGFFAIMALVLTRPLYLTDILIFLVMFSLTELGITVGYHRYYTHRGFTADRGVKWLLGAWGAMAAQGPITYWVAHHRAHHRYSDSADDPHSPISKRHASGTKFRQFLHSHIGWMLYSDLKERKRYTLDLRRDDIVKSIDAHYHLWVIAGLVIPGLFGMMIHQSFFGFIHGFIFGGIGRLFFVHQATWSVNSICHLFGTRPYKTRDNSRNNLLVALLTMGEGWHNNHHAFPRSARHGLRWWQIDPSYYFIKLLEVLGVVRDIRLPAPNQPIT